MPYKIKDALRLETQSLARPQRSDLPKSELRDRMDKFQPRLARMGGTPGFSRVGASTGIPGSGTGPTMVSSPLYYDPRWSSPDKFYFPRTEEQANSIWRHLYVTDPSSAVALDLYSQSPWSEFDLVGIDDKTIVHVYEDAISEARLLEKLPRFTLEFLKLGKCIVHNIFDNSRGIWIGAFHHNPDNIKVTGVPWFGYEPLMDLRPTREMEWFASSPDRRAREITKRLPPEIVQMIRTGKAIPLDNSNVTYIGRKSADYELLGTSILTRLFRVQMLEDVLANATIAVAQRNAAPLRIFKIGDPSTGWIPTDDDGHAEQLMELLAVAETDPFAAIVYHSGLCLLKGTRITIADGTTMPVEDLSTGETLMGGDKNGKPVEIVRVDPRQYEGELVRIDIEGLLEPIIMTPEHKLPAIIRTSCKNRWDGEPCEKYALRTGRLHKPYCDQIWSKVRPEQDIEWTYAGKLKTGDYLVSPTCAPEISTAVTPGEARLLGYYVADGFTQSLHGDPLGATRFSIGATKDDVIQDISKICMGLNCFEPKLYSPQHTDNARIISLHAPQERVGEVTRWLVHHGGRIAHTKKLSQEVMEWPRSLQLEFLHAYFRCDGTIPRSKQIVVKVTTASKELADQLIRMLHINEFVCSVEISNNSGGYSIGRTHYTLKLYGPYAIRMEELIKGHSNRELPKIKGSNQVLNGWAQYRISNISRIESSDLVYNIETTGSHVYLANYLSSHNSVEYVGVSDKMMSITREFDFIERVKMLALGISKSFLLGETSFASAIAGLQALAERLRSLRDKIEQSYIYPKFLNPLALVHGFRERRAADLDHRVRTSSRHGQSDLIVPEIRWRKSLDPIQDQTLLSTWQALHEKGILSDRTYAIGSGLSLDIERKNLEEEAKWKATFAAKYGAGAEGDEAGGLGGLGMGAPMPGGEPMPEDAPEEAPEGGGGEARGSSLRTANGGVRVRPDDVAAVRSILRGEDPNHSDWTGYLERMESKGLDHNDSDALDEHLVSLGLTDAEITEVLRQAGLRRMPIRIGSIERDRRGFDKAMKDLKGLSENGSTLLSGI